MSDDRACRTCEHWNALTSVEPCKSCLDGDNLPAWVPMVHKNVATPPSALTTQVAGDHYKDMKIQPMEYSMANGLDACQHTAIKYVSRFRSKGGVEDLRKAIHVIEMLIEFEERKAHE